jgi:hypothetical protein
MLVLHLWILDLVMDLERLDFFQQNKGNFLYFAATANSTMDYSAKVIEDSVVDSPPSCGRASLTVSSLPPLRGRPNHGMSILSTVVDSRSFHK